MGAVIFERDLLRSLWSRAVSSKAIIRNKFPFILMFLVISTALVLWSVFAFLALPETPRVMESTIMADYSSLHDLAYLNKLVTKNVDYLVKCESIYECVEQRLLNISFIGHLYASQPLTLALHGKRGEGLESIILSFPHVTQKGSNNTLAMAVGLSLAEVCSRMPFWSRDIFFVFPISPTEDYHDLLHIAQNHIATEVNDPKGTPTSINSAISVELDSMETLLGNLDVHMASSNGILPKLDFVAIINTFFDTQGIRKPPNSYVQMAKNIFTFFAQQAFGIPYRMQSSFSYQGIDSFTLIWSQWDPSKEKHSFDLHTVPE